MSDTETAAGAAQADDLPEAVSARRARMKQRQERSSGAGGNDGTGGKTAKIPEEKMLGLAEEAKVGPLCLVMKAPKIKEMRGLYDSIWQTWPDVIVYAALTDRPKNGGSIDLAATAALQTAGARSADPDAPEVTAGAVADDLKRLALSVASDNQVLETVAESLWRVCSETPGLTREGLPDLLAEHFTVPELADVLRRIFDCCGGGPGAELMKDRFTTP